MSTDSGIPDFRSETGLYKTNLRAEEMISHHYFMENTESFYEFYKEKMVFEDARPNFGHQFIADLEKDPNKHISVVTQNIDGLHQMAGSSEVYELHGSIHRNYCMKCNCFYPLKKIIETNGIPKCDKCGSVIKPDVVLYEEGLDEDTIDGAVKAIANADLMIILGTSLNVYPAASFVSYFRGNCLAIVNKSATPADNQCDIVIHDGISETFKKIVEK